MQNMEAPETWRGYATVCRLCLQKDGFMLGIFNHIQGKDKSIYKKIMDCTALQISFGDGLPNVICHRCLFKIEFCLEFRQLCFVSDATLRQFNGVVNKENGEANPLFDQLVNGNDEDVVLVVDPMTMDYNSDYDTENELSDTENVDNPEQFECRNVSMCKFCDYAFTDKSECLNHENTHNQEIPYNCTDCTMGFADRLQYSAHLKSVHQNDKPYNCPQCDRTFARRSDLRKHTIVHTGIKPFTCTVCFKSFSRNTNLSKHMRIHSGQKPFVCPKCPKTFISKGDLTRHAIIHSGQKPFSCNYCTLSFGRRDKLLRHEKKHWPQENSEDKTQELQALRENLLSDYSYPPKESNGDPEDKQDGWMSSENMVITLDPFNHNNFGNMDRETNSETENPTVQEGEKLLEAKEEVIDPELPPIPEHITGDSFSNSPDLDKPKPFSCGQCNKMFSTPENLRYHQASHTGVRPYSCTVCTKTFIRKRELDRHVVTHTGMKPFKCTMCNKGFGRKDKLIRHMRIHDSNKEHGCNVCDASFSRKDSLLQHMKNHNPVEQDLNC